MRGSQKVCCEALTNQTSISHGRAAWSKCALCLIPVRWPWGPQRHRQTQSYADREGFAVVDRFCSVFKSSWIYTLGKFDGLVLSPHKISPNWCWGYLLLAWIVCLLGEKPLWPSLDQHCWNRLTATDLLKPNGHSTPGMDSAGCGVLLTGSTVSVHFMNTQHHHTANPSQPKWEITSNWGWGGGGGGGGSNAL